MNVFDDQKRRAVLRSLLDHVRSQREHRLLAHRRSEARCGRVVGKRQTQEISQQWQAQQPVGIPVPYSSLDVRDLAFLPGQQLLPSKRLVGHVKQSTKGLTPGRIGNAPAGSLTNAESHLPSLSNCPFAQFGPQVALADSGFTAEHGDLPFASVARVTEDLLQPGYLTVASNRGGVELGRLNPAIPPSERS